MPIVERKVGKRAEQNEARQRQIDIQVESGRGRKDRYRECRTTIKTVTPDCPIPYQKTGQLLTSKQRE